MAIKQTTPKRGRPTKRCAKVERAIVLALKRGNTRANAARLAGISYVTLCRWVRLSDTFRHALDEAEAHAENTYVAALVKQAREGNFQSAKFWLSTRKRDDWREPPTEIRVERREVRERAERLAAELDLPVEEVERDLVLGVEAVRP